MINPEIKLSRKRKYSFRDIEKATQRRSKNKEKNSLFRSSIPRRYLFAYNKFKIFEVDGEWIRNNVYAWFGIGGHGRVHLFIPNNEIWIEPIRNCEYTARTIIHEIKEYKLMGKKLPFYHAHLSSLTEELRNKNRLDKLTNLLRIHLGERNVS